MRFDPKLLGILSFLLFALCASAPAPEADPTQVPPLAFVHVNVITMTRDEVLRDQTVITDQSKVTQIGPSTSTRIPRNAFQIDGRGKYLMPGLADLHVHLRDPSELLSYLAHGVTTVVHMSGPTGNVPNLPALRQSIVAGETLGGRCRRDSGLTSCSLKLIPSPGLITSLKSLA